MNTKDFVVFDFETGGLKPGHNEPLELAAIVYNCRTLEPYPESQGGTFHSYMKPTHWDRLEEGAMRVNKISMETLKNAPDQSVVWTQFVSWVLKFNPKKTSWTAPIAAGKNIRGFDLHFVDVLNQLHCPKKEKTVLFSPRTIIDLEDLLFPWFENEREPENMKMDTLRDYFGMSKDGAHSALVDTLQTGDLVMRFLKLSRSFQERKLVKFKGACAA